MINRIVLIFACFAVFQSLIFSWSECKAGFYLDVPIQVIDSDHINMPGVNVSMTYQKNSNYYSPGQEELVTTDSILTDSNGMATFKIKNDVPSSRYLSCKLAVHVSYFNSTKNYTFDLGTFYGKYIINMTAKNVIISMVDSSGKPISGSLVLYPSAEFQMNNSISLIVPFGSTPGYLIFNGHRQGISINVDNSTPNSVNAVFRTYDVNVSVFDDSGKPIPFTVQLGAEEPINSTDTVKLRTIDNPSSLKINAYGRETLKQINPEKENNISIFYDIHSPQIGNINVIPDKEGSVSIAYSVSDNGAKASGIRETGVYVDQVYYSAALKYSSAKVSISKTGSFSFTVTATDNDGNSADVSADYVSGKAPVITANNSSSPLSNNTVVTPPATQKGDDNGTLILIIIVVLVLVVGVYFYIKSNYLSS